MAAGAHGPVIDCDIHHELPHEQDLVPYLSTGWQEYVRHPEPHPWISVFPPFPFVNPHGFDREDSIPGDGTASASSLEMMREQLLDPNGIEHGVLTNGFGIYLAGLANPYFAAEVARALNDFTRERWLDREPRLKGSIALAPQTPEESAAEIRRLAPDGRFVEAMLCTNPVGHGFGHPLFDPIHRACAETGLAIAIHSLGDTVSGSAAAALAGGRPVTYYESHTGALQGMMTHLMSFITHGVFERYPDLRLVLTEGGITWIPAFLRRMDTNWKGLRREIPWVKRSPSEVFHAHVRVTSQPMDIESAGDPLLEPLVAIGFEDNLLFSSDYPHWDSDNVGITAARLPAAWREKVLWRNAAELYGLEVPLRA
jgi:predicted TIM-barrel fold metal-dependent hydrolase